jgi:hypothetical protein
LLLLQRLLQRVAGCALREHDVQRLLVPLRDQHFLLARLQDDRHQVEQQPQ